MAIHPAVVTRARRIWNEEQLRIAVQRLIDAVYGRKTDAPAALHIPAWPTDADLILNDAIGELMERRAERQAMETTAHVLRRMVRYYEGRARVARNLMNDSTDSRVACGHALDALRWDARAEAVRQVAVNLEIALPAQEKTNEH